eukprot:5399553-Prymnesium_polylepis.1
MSGAAPTMSRYHTPAMQRSLRRDVHALAVGLLKEVARVEVGLSEALDVDELVRCGAVPDAPRVGLAVQGHLEPPHKREAARRGRRRCGTGSRPG